MKIMEHPIISSLIIFQQAWKNAIVKPSGPNALSLSLSYLSPPQGPHSPQMVSLTKWLLLINGIKSKAIQLGPPTKLFINNLS
jgi:hypothetical protein